MPKLNVVFFHLFPPQLTLKGLVKLALKTVVCKCQCELFGTYSEAVGLHSYLVGNDFQNKCLGESFISKQEADMIYEKYHTR